MVTRVKGLKKAFLIVVVVDLARLYLEEIALLVAIHDHISLIMYMEQIIWIDMDFILDSSRIYYIVMRSCHLW